MLGFLVLLQRDLLLSVLTVTDIILNNGVKNGDTLGVYLKGEERLRIANHIAAVVSLSIIGGHLLLLIFFDVLIPRFGI